MKIRYTEIFYSLQGEGKFTGVPSVFLRLFGCNLKCQGFGMPRGELSEERLGVNPADYIHFDDLPLVSTGCDSYASWDPRFKHLATDVDLDKLVDDLLAKTPNNSWIMPNGQDIHLVITGGEPMMWQKIYPELFTHDRMKNLVNVTFETNTTKPLTSEFENWIKNNSYWIDESDRVIERPCITWSCSPKLSASGELWEKAIRPDVAAAYYKMPFSDMYFKFVIDSEESMDEVEKAIAVYKEAGVDCPVYCMPVGGLYDDYKKNTRIVAEAVMKHGLRYSPRLHSDLFGNAWGT